MYLAGIRVLSLSFPGAILYYDFIAENKAAAYDVNGDISLTGNARFKNPPSELSSKLHLVQDTVVYSHSTCFVASATVNSPASDSIQQLKHRTYPHFPV